MYTIKLDKMTAAQVWHAWKNQLLTVAQVVEWQTKHNYFFTPTGGKANV